MKKLYIKFWAFVYRKTGYYNRTIDSIILEHIEEIAASKIEEQIKHPENGLSLKQLIGINIGLWQAHNGFYRSYKQGDKFKRRLRLKFRLLMAKIRHTLKRLK